MATAMFKTLFEVALSPFKRSPIVVRTTTPHSVPFFHLDTLQAALTAAVDGVRGSNRPLMTRTPPRSPYRCATAELSEL